MYFINVCLFTEVEHTVDVAESEFSLLLMNLHNSTDLWLFFMILF